MSAGQSVSSNAPIIPINDKTSLSFLLETAAQKSYHELCHMVEILQNKNCLERKKELVKFACRTRQLFIRLLGVVKWAATAGKVHACEDIQHILERHALLLRETSDVLAQLAREKLITTRLTNYPLTDAVDALTLGTINYLPERISEATAPFVPVTENERRQILPRLQQILTARLAIAEVPIQFTSFEIKNGLITLSVDGEFQVKMGVTSDNLFVPWHIYKTTLFLRDPEEPEQELVHPGQMQALTNYIQSWLVESDNPFVELYRYLHYYCQSLRLQILYEQAHRIRNRSVKQKHLHVSNYTPCKSLHIEYWKECNGINLHKKQSTQEKSRDISLTILCDEDGKFQLIHWPPLPVEDSVAILQILEKQNFTIEEILHRTIFARSRRRFEELKEVIHLITSAKVEIDLMIPALKCDLLPESRSEEMLFISINPFSGLYKVVSYMETRLSLQIEHALNRDHGNLTEAINLFKIWLIQKRIPSLLAHTNCRVYTRLPSLNIRNELIVPFVNNSIFIELAHNEGYYILVHISDANQLLVQYYFLIFEKRSSLHDPLVLQQQQTQQNLPYNQPIQSSDEYAKWIVEPLVICALDSTAFSRKELFELKNIVPINKSKDAIIDEHGMKRGRPASLLSLKSLFKLVNYYDEMLSYTFIKEEFQRKKTICKGIMYSPWTGVPQLDIVRTFTGDDSFQSNTELFNYVNECFWPRLMSSTVRLAHLCRETQNMNKLVERQWILQLQLPDTDYFRNPLVTTPYNVILGCTQITWKSHAKIVDYFHHELRAAFELTHLFESYALTLTESTDLRAITEVGYFNFFKCSIYYGPNLNFDLTLTPRSNVTSTDNYIHLSSLFDLRFTNLNSNFLNTAQRILSTKLLKFLSRTRSLKQFLRLLHMTALPLALIGRLNCYNRPVVLGAQGICSQPLLSFVPYTESRWRLIFGQFFALDIQICGPNLILVRDGAYSVQLNGPLPEIMPIPRFKEFLSKFADDRGLTYEFAQITDRLRDRDFLLPELQLPVSNTTVNYNAPILTRTMTSGTAQTPQLLHPVGTPNPSFNSLTPGSVGPASQQQQPVNSPSQPVISPGSNLMGNSPLMPVSGSPMPNPNSAQMNGPGSVGVPNPSPGIPFDGNYLSPNVRSMFPTSLIGPSPETPGNLINSSVPTPSNTRLEDYNVKLNSSSSLHSYNRCLSSKPSYPVYMTQQTFFRMLYTPDGRQWSKLETFLASSILIKHFSRSTAEANDQNNAAIRSVPGEVDIYRVEHLSLQIAFPFDVQTSTYRMQLTSFGDVCSQQPSNVNWTAEELQTLENFFNQHLFPSSIMSEGFNSTAVVSPDMLSLSVLPNRHTIMGALQKMISSINPRVLRDLIKVIRLEKNPEMNHNWRVRWCLSFPHGASFQQVGLPALHPAGTSGFIFAFHLTPRTVRNDIHMMGNSHMATTTPFVVLLQHDMPNNQTMMYEKVTKSNVINEQRYQNISKILLNSRENISKCECSLYPSIYEIVTSLQVSMMSAYPS